MSNPSRFPLGRVFPVNSPSGMFLQCHSQIPDADVNNLRHNRVNMKPNKTTSRYLAPALEKGLDILELFAREPTGLTKSDVARQLGRTMSEIFRMMSCLEDRG